MSTQRILLKGLLLFIAVSVVFALVFPMQLLGKISLYNFLFQGRYRLPYSNNPTQDYSISTYNLEALFASHTINAAEKTSDEFRVIVIGDSSSWGFLLNPSETLSSAMNDLDLKLEDGREVRVFNMAYPVMSLTKDLAFLDRALEYEPDLIIWLLTLESFPKDKQLFPPLLQNNPKVVRQLIAENQLDLDPDDPRMTESDFWDHTIVGSRRDLADLIRLQLYGIMWSATGIDHAIPESYTPRREDLPADITYHDLSPPDLDPDDLSLDVLSAGIANKNDVPVLIVNEPIFISAGENSDIRYNFMYPKWVYDQYRALLETQAETNNWFYLDLWDAIPAQEFTNTAVHISPAGTRMLAELIYRAILDFQIQNQ